MSLDIFLHVFFYFFLDILLDILVGLIINIRVMSFFPSSLGFIGRASSLWGSRNIYLGYRVRE